MSLYTLLVGDGGPTVEDSCQLTAASVVSPACTSAVVGRVWRLLKAS